MSKANGNKNNELVIHVGGESGEGIVTIGEIFTRIAAFTGLNVFTFRTFPAEILGGHVTYQARIGSGEVHSQGDVVDVLVAMNKEGYQNHVANLRPGGAIVYDSTAFTLPEFTDRTLYPIPVTELAKELDFMRGKNLIMIGALVELFGLPLDRAEKLVHKRLGRFQDLLPNNLASLKKGYAYASENYQRSALSLDTEGISANEDRVIVDGNQAIAMGALAAGCRFYAGYPITPATSIMEFMAGELPKFGGTLIQAEDEIAAINMAIGASFAGKKAMTATSGPGVALMLEAFGLASMAEVPLVLVNVQRGGPSTGLPTKTSQGDLFMALYGGSDDTPRFVMAPTSVEDCYYSMITAFNLAERYQMPVIVLSDQAMAPRIRNIPAFETNDIQVMDRIVPLGPSRDGIYRRYELTETGISPMAVPGTSGTYYTAEGLEHNEIGAPNYAPEMHRRMMEKRYRKVETARRDLRDWDLVVRWGDPDAKIGILGWGSTMGPVQEGIARAQSEGIEVDALFTKILLPMPDHDIRRFLEGKDAIIVPELNYTGQFAKVVEHRYNVEVIKLNKYNGIPFRTSEIYNKIIDVADSLGR